jgi:glycosyltransferase involved in cell wall biosynthesis
MKRRLAVLASHPIHYQAPLWRLLAADPEIETTVFFQDHAGLRPYHDPGFDKIIQWDLPLTEGYRHYAFKNSLNFLRQLRRGNYDALLVHAWSSPATWLAVASAKIFGVKTLLRAENPWNQEIGRSGAKHVLRNIALRMFFAMIDAFLYIGEENRQFYLHYGIPERKLFFTPHAVENERFFKEAERLAPQRENIRKSIGLKSNAVVFLTVGKFIEKKRHLDLLRAYERFDEPNKALVIVGEGALRQKLEQFIDDKKLPNVHLPGFVGQTEIAKYYVAADVFVLPSGQGETWGLVINEAMCFGLPVIVSDTVGSASDLVRDGKNGYVFPLGKVDALVHALEDLAGNDGKREGFGRESKELITGYDYEADVLGIKTAMGLNSTNQI